MRWTLHFTQHLNWVFATKRYIIWFEQKNWFELLRVSLWYPSIPSREQWIVKSKFLLFSHKKIQWYVTYPNISLMRRDMKPSHDNTYPYIWRDGSNTDLECRSLDYLLPSRLHFYIHYKKKERNIKKILNTNIRFMFSLL